MKFKALIPFAYADKVYDMHNPEPYEEEKELVLSWKKAGYCSVVEGEEETPAETDEKAPEEDEKPLEELGYNELKKRAKAAGIPKYNSMKTEDLIKSLRGE
jgi:Holliday junction resolvasome RuvABC DNA-binding subunit